MIKSFIQPSRCLQNKAYREIHDTKGETTDILHFLTLMSAN